MSIYQLKPAFQNLLRPGVVRLHAWGVTANQVTVLACVISVVLGLGLFFLAVGMSLDLSRVAADWRLIVSGVLAYTTMLWMVPLSWIDGEKVGRRAVRQTVR